ncbi:MAG: hypothetical protein DYG90_15065 [Chloroflexi bacterium CFX6]|nr:hypothetical protein [Chloroflexi bacterium CFX6]
MPRAIPQPEAGPPAPPSDAGPTGDLLSDILDRVDGWLKFAEAKNLAVTILTGTASAALIGLLRGADAMPPLAATAFTAAELAFLAALGTAIWSFRPQRAPAIRPTPPPPGAADNLLYSGHLAAYAPEDLAAEVARRYAGAAAYDPADHPFHVALAGQIVVNAVITNAKLRAFNRASVFALVGLVLLGAGLVVELVR